MYFLATYMFVRQGDVDVMNEGGKPHARVTDSAYCLRLSTYSAAAVAAGIDVSLRLLVLYCRPLLTH